MSNASKSSTPIRAFPVFVSDCKTCPLRKYSEGFKEFYCDAITDGGFSYAADVYLENENGITKSCPMWKQSKMVQVPPIKVKVKTSKIKS
jgi:hypothetical protein